MSIGWRAARSLALVAALALASPAFAATITLKTKDGASIKADEVGKGTNAVVLVHDKGRSHDDWTYFAGKLADNGWRVLSVDLRGHGESKPPDSLTADDYKAMVNDVAAATTYLKSKGAQKIAVVGASFGANLALNLAAEDPNVTNLILLSPGLNLQGVTVTDAMDKYAGRPVLMVASYDDAYALKSVNALDERAKGDKHVELLEDAGAGAKMLNKNADLESLMIAWLNGTYRLSQGDKQATRNVSTGDTTEMETTGKKFGEK